MPIPTWGQQLIRVQTEHSTKLNEHSQKLDEHSAKLDKHTSILNEHSGKLDNLSLRLERMEIMQADLMVFLEHKFAEIARHFDVTVEQIRSDNRAFWELQKEHVRVLDDHETRIGVVEEMGQAATSTSRSLSKRVTVLEAKR